MHLFLDVFLFEVLIESLLLISLTPLKEDYLNSEVAGEGRSKGEADSISLECIQVFNKGFSLWHSIIPVVTFCC